LANPPRTLATDGDDAQLHRDMPKAVLLLDFMACDFRRVWLA
jgi:hypothetical protein